MSEYQYIAFRALDRPLTDKELAFAETQSSRAEITKWSFTNEYHYGDFRGDPDELLQNGYDIQLHYASYGIRTLKFRLPAKLPFSPKIWKNYVDGQRVAWKEFKTRGRGGVLTIYPVLEGVDYLADPEDYLDLAAQVREDLLRGDLRTLYVLWLCGACDADDGAWDSIEPPVPAGLKQVSKACSELLAFFDLDPLTVAAAAEKSGPAPELASEEELVDRWVQAQTADACRELVRRLLLDTAHEVRVDTLAKLRGTAATATWPTTPGTRTFEQLVERATQLREEEKARARVRAQKAALREADRLQQVRLARMAKMAQDPRAWLKEADRLVNQRNTGDYNAAAEILADLRAAVGGEKGAQMARAHAAKLAAKFPTLNRLKSALRKQGLL